jgi:uncharacterized protein (DUF1499 family)
MRFQSFAARVAFGAFLLALVICLAAAFGTRLGLWDAALGIRILAPGVVIGIVGALFGAIWVGSSLARNSSVGARSGVLGLLGSAAVIAIPLHQLFLFYTSPPIHDISTDIEFAPPFKALLPLRAGATNGPGYDGPNRVFYEGKRTTVSALQKKYDIGVIPYVAFGKPAKIFWRAKNLADDMGWNVVAFDPKEGRIEATDTTFWFGFTDDIVIRVKPAGKLGARLDIRSKSRTGVSDMGRNAERIRDYIKRLKTM